VLQAISSDTWANYQAKNIRRHTDELFNDLTSVEPTTEATTLAKLRDQYSQEADRYKDEMKELQDKANELDAEVKVERHRADRYDLAEVFLEIGLVITSITLLSGRRLFWALGIGLGVVGLGITVTGFIVH
jgi:inorganic triphosphatase YgiF